MFFLLKTCPRLQQRHQSSVIDVNLVASVVFPGGPEKWLFLKNHHTWLEQTVEFVST